MAVGRVYPRLPTAKFLMATDRGDGVAQDIDGNARPRGRAGDAVKRRRCYISGEDVTLQRLGASR
jgi:hypothetical protein